MSRYRVKLMLALAVIGSASVLVVMLQLRWKNVENQDIKPIEAPQSSEPAEPSRPGEPVGAVYLRLADEMIRDIEGDPRFYFSSSSEYYRHKNYERIAVLGRPIVPILISEIKAGQHKLFHPEILSKILPNVDLGHLYGRPNYMHDANLYCELWLRWWDDTGCREKWDEKK